MTKQYNKYLIGAMDQFDSSLFPFLDDEIRIINMKTDSCPLNFKADIIVSFLKDHAIQSVWAAANPELTRLVSTPGFFAGNIESLFESCRDNPLFRQGLQCYLHSRFAGKVPEAL